MTITMAHGNGGYETSQLIADIFARHFDHPALRSVEDAALLSVAGEIAFTTDSFVVQPLFFPGGDIGRLAVCGTVNDLAVMGATPRYLTCAVILEEGLDTADLEKIVRSMAQAAKEAGVAIVTGDTKVVEGHGGVYINTSGIGTVKRALHVAQAQVGDALIVSGRLGDHHAAILSHRLQIQNDICSDAAPLAALADALLEQGVRAMRDITRGGLSTVLCEIAAACGHCLEIDERALPVSPQVKGLCDLLGLSPLTMGNEGKLLAIVPQQHAQRALEAMRASSYGANACVIGRIVDGFGARLRTELGGLRSLDVLRGEGLPRIC